MIKKDESIRTYVRGVYDVQKMRIMMGNRIVANFKARLGQAPSEAEDELDEDAQQILKDLRARHKKITDGVKTFPRRASFKGDNLISNYTELCLIDQYVGLEDNETRSFARLGQMLRDYPVYNEFLEPIKGIGPAMAGVIISEIDISKSRHISSLWKYAGLDVAPDGRGRSRRKEQMEEVVYTDKDGNEQLKKTLGYNPFLKTKLMGVLASSFLRAGAKDNPYREIYDKYKHRMEQRADYEDNKGRAHQRAMRYMVKMFLLHLYLFWRESEGLWVSKPYSEDKLDMPPHGGQ